MGCTDHLDKLPHADHNAGERGRLMREWVKELRKPGEAYRAIGCLAVFAGFFPPLWYLDKDAPYRMLGQEFSGGWLIGPHLVLALAGLLLYVETSSKDKDADPAQDRPVMYRALSLSAFIWWSCYLATHLRA